MPAPTRVNRALYSHEILVGIRAALLANSTITALVASRVYPGADVSGGAFPFLDYFIVSDVTQGTYSHAGFNDLVQVTARDKGMTTGNVVALANAIQTALLDTAWSVTGWTIIGVTRENARLLPPDIQDGIVFQNYPVTLRIQAIHN